MIVGLSAFEAKEVSLSPHGLRKSLEGVTFMCIFMLCICYIIRFGMVVHILIPTFRSQT